MASKKGQLSDVEAALLDPAIWQNQSKSTDLMKRQKNLKRIIELYEDMAAQLEELEIIADLALAEGDDSMAEEFESSLAALLKNVDKMSLETLFSGEYDNENAILSVHAGSGGLDAMDWADMLYRMYLRWAEQNGYKLTVLDYNYDPIGGLKNATVKIAGSNAYGYLKSEKGVHRLVRISPFDSSGRRHTSFAAVDIIPELDDDVEIDIAADDLKIDTYRSSGAGGQHVNTTDSANGKVDRLKRARAQRAHRRHSGRLFGDLVGQSNSLIRLSTLSNGQRSSHRRGKRQCQRGDGWRFRGVYDSVFKQFIVLL